MTVTLISPVIFSSIFCCLAAARLLFYAARMSADKINYRKISSTLFTEVQAQICAALEELDGKAQFKTDNWTRKENRKETAGGHGGGGKTRILRNGGLFDSAGVNFSEVYGFLPEDMSFQLANFQGQAPFYATGISLVLHPRSPKIPTTHANFRYLEVHNLSWFGGGWDLTPYYLVEDDCRHWHKVSKDVCDKHNPLHYPRFKKWCDEYFYLPHRAETRGIGGLFFDYLGKDEPEELDRNFLFVDDLARSFMKAYLPIVHLRKDEPWNEDEKRFQLLRRGRYVEFNLLYDRGTMFGLKTGGRTESILMSLPPDVKWEYNYQAPKDSREAKLLEVLSNPREWV